MRILHVVASIGSRSGGLGPIALGFAQTQHRLGHDPAIWTLDSPNEACEIAHAWELHNSIVTSTVLGPASIGYSPSAERLSSSMVGGDYSVVHQHGIWMANSRVSNRWRATFGRPTLIAPQGALEAGVLKRSASKKHLASLWYENEHLRSASCLQATAAAEVVSFRNYGLTKPIAVIPNGIPDSWLNSLGDSNRFLNRYNLPSDKRLLLFLSRIHPKKGLPLLFEALARIRDEMSDWYLVIAGPDELGHRHELELLAAKLDIKDMLCFVGPLFGDQKRDAFAAAELFVLPTYSEGAPIAILEALGAGVPVITTYGAPWEELETYSCGWWVDIKVDSILNALIDATRRSSYELAAMGLRGKSLLREKYTWTQVSQKLQLLYEWLLGRTKQPDFVIMD
jgi:glycosyltransferase involved in cell wall biosynthesis